MQFYMIQTYTEKYLGFQTENQVFIWCAQRHMDKMYFGTGQIKTLRQSKI